MLLLTGKALYPAHWFSGSLFFWCTISSTGQNKFPDKDKIFEFNYEATKLAIKRAVEGQPTVKEALAKKDKAKHPFA